MSDNKLKVVALIRVSTKEQAQDDRAGMARQREVINKTLRLKDLDCLRIYEVNDVSGTNVQNCPEVQEILRLVQTGSVSGVVVADLDRLLRPDNFSDFALLQVFQDSGAILYCGDSEIHLASKDGFLLGGIRAAIAGFELRLIKERMQGAKEQKRRQGKCPSAAITLPRGVAYDRKHERFVYTPEVTSVVEAFRLVDEEGIINYVELERHTGIPHRTLHNLLRNPIYMGIRRYSMKRGKEKYHSDAGRQSDRRKVRRSASEIIEVKVINEPAVPQDRFARVQQRLSESHSSWRKRRYEDTSVNLAVGIGRCGYCGDRLYCASGKRRNRARQGYYFCKRNHYLFKHRLGGCQMQNVRQDVLDNTIKRLAVEKLTDRTFTKMLVHHFFCCREASGQKVEPTSRTVDAIAKLEQREKRIFDAYEVGQIDLEGLKQRTRTVREEIARTKLMQERNASKTNEPATEETLVRLFTYGSAIVSRSKSPETQQQAIRQLFTKLVFQDERLVSFQLNPQFAANCCQKTAHTGRDSWPPRA